MTHWNQDSFTTLRLLNDQLLSQEDFESHQIQLQIENALMIKHNDYFLQDSDHVMKCQSCLLYRHLYLSKSFCIYHHLHLIICQIESQQHQLSMIRCIWQLSWSFYDVLMTESWSLWQDMLKNDRWVIEIHESVWKCDFSLDWQARKCWWYRWWVVILIAHIRTFNWIINHKLNKWKFWILQVLSWRYLRCWKFQVCFHQKVSQHFLTWLIFIQYN